MVLPSCSNIWQSTSGPTTGASLQGIYGKSPAGCWHVGSSMPSWTCPADVLQALQSSDFFGVSTFSDVVGQPTPTPCDLVSRALTTINLPKHLH